MTEIRPVVTGEVIEPMCDTFWGSHGCDLPDRHCRDEQPVHQCGDDTDPCDQIRRLPDGRMERRAALYAVHDDDTVSETDWEWDKWGPTTLELFRMDGKPVR